MSTLLGLLLALAGQAPLHIHAYADHDHPEHHHGPAAHDHDRPAGHQDDHDDSVNLEACGPASHAVSLVGACPPLPEIHLVAAECASPVVRIPLLPVASIHEFSDVRVHGPPPQAQAPSRAPPLTHLA